MANNSPSEDINLFLKYQAVIAVSCAYLILMILFQIFQSFSKWNLYLKQKKKHKGERQLSFQEAHYGEEGRLDKMRLTADRSVGNTLEWSWMFMAPLWMHAIFISVPDAAYYGWTYVIVRAGYPLLFYKKFVWAVTFLNYLSLFMLMSPLVYKILSG